MCNSLADVFSLYAALGIQDYAASKAEGIERFLKLECVQQVLHGTVWTSCPVGASDFPCDGGLVGIGQAKGEPLTSIQGSRPPRKRR